MELINRINVVFYAVFLENIRISWLLCRSRDLLVIKKTGEANMAAPVFELYAQYLER